MKELINPLRNIIVNPKNTTESCLQQIELLEQFSKLNFKDEAILIHAISFCFEVDRSDLLQKKFIPFLKQNPKLLQELSFYNLYFFGARKCYGELKEVFSSIDFKKTVTAPNYVLPNIPMMILSANNHNLFLVEYYIKENPDIFEVFYSKQTEELLTVFDTAVYAKDEKALKFLLLKFKNTANDNNHQVFLHRALDTLCQQAVDQNQKEFNKIQLVKFQLLKEAGANPFALFELIPNFKSKRDGSFILHHVVASGVLWLVTFLRQQFPNEPIDQINASLLEKGYTLLQVATVNNNLALVNFLLKQNAEPTLHSSSLELFEGGGCAIEIAIFKNDQQANTILDIFLTNSVITIEKLRSYLIFAIDRGNLYAIDKLLYLLTFDDLFEMESENSFFHFVLRAINTENEAVIKKIIIDRGLKDTYFLNKKENGKHNMLSLACYLNKKQAFSILLKNGASIYDLSVGTSDKDLERIKSIDSSMAARCAILFGDKEPFFYSVIMEKHYQNVTPYIKAYMKEHEIENELTALIFLDIPYCITHVIRLKKENVTANFIEPKGKYAGMSPFALAVLEGKKRHIKELNSLGNSNWYQEITFPTGERKTILELFRESEFFQKDDFFYYVLLLRYSKDKNEVKKAKNIALKEEQKYLKYSNESEIDFSKMFIATINNDKVLNENPYFLFIQVLITKLEDAFKNYNNSIQNNDNNTSGSVAFIRQHEIEQYLFRLFQAIHLYCEETKQHSVFPVKLFRELRNVNMHNLHNISSKNILGLAQVCINNKKLFLSRVQIQKQNKSQKPKKISMQPSHVQLHNPGDFHFLQTWLYENKKEIDQSKLYSTEEKLILIEKYLKQLKDGYMQFRKDFESFYEPALKNICVRIGECFQKIEEYDHDFYEKITQEMDDFRIIEFFRLVVREELGHKFPMLEEQKVTALDTIWGTDFHNLFLAYFNTYDWQAFSQSLYDDYQEMKHGVKPN